MKFKKYFFAASVIICLVLCSCFFVAGIYKSKANDSDMVSKESDFFTGVSIDSVTDFQNESLYKLCKVWGLAKYYHPAVVEGNIDWDQELFSILPKVYEAKTSDEVNEVLYTWLSKYEFEQSLTTEEMDTFIEQFTTIGTEDGLKGYVLDLSWTKNTSIYGEKLSSYLVKLICSCGVPNNNSYAFYDENYDICFKNEKDYEFNSNDDGLKLLALFRFWNIYEYFSPNIDITKKNWEDVLKDSIRDIIATDSYKDYVLCIAEVSAYTGDAHLSVIDKENTFANFYGKYYVPCTIKSINGQIVVESVSDEAKSSGLNPGDVLIKIDNTTIDERINMLKKYVAISEENKYELYFSMYCLTSQENKATVTVLRNDKELTVQVNALEESFSPKKKYKNGIIKDTNIGYIDPSELKQGELVSLMNSFLSTDGIIVDLRNYPSVVDNNMFAYILGEYVIPNQTVFAKYTYNLIESPGKYYYKDMMAGKGILNDSGDTTDYPLYKGKVIILSNESSYSQAEMSIMLLRQAPNATVVGSNTIGTDGTNVHYVLPGGVTLGISSFGVFTPEGGQTQRIGVQPDVECYPTIKGLSEVRDELVEKGIEIITQ